MDTRLGSDVLGKNARKRLRRKQEEQRRKSVHEGLEAAASEETVKQDAETATKQSREKSRPDHVPKKQQPLERRRETRQRQRQIQAQPRTVAANEADDLESCKTTTQQSKVLGELFDPSSNLVEKASKAEQRSVREATRKPKENVKKTGKEPEKVRKTVAEKTASRPSRARPYQTEPPEPWQAQKRALQTKFPEGWSPRKKLSPDALEGIRALHRQFPDTYTTATLARHFQVSPEAIRRILKSSWQASPEEEEDRQLRWFGRGKQVWSRWAELGRKPPKRWQAEGIRRDPMSWPGGRKRLMERQQLQTRQSRQAFQSQLSAEGTRDHNIERTGKSGDSLVAAQHPTPKSVDVEVSSSPLRARTPSRGRQIRLQAAGLRPKTTV
ncbi:Required for respiratory growth protein 9 mitochondrial [Sporothrix epigloea]|uniref:Required for respiratory growth protein 9, mitochondrial n=1 Tax=Sporothrix epigloea TaxID=1892477 RepID=A0ABP0DWK8_9PEZI